MKTENQNTWKTWAKGEPEKWPCLVGHKKDGKIVDACLVFGPLHPDGAKYWTHWAPAPELPVPPQREKDDAAVAKLWDKWLARAEAKNIAEFGHAALAHARAEILAEWERSGTRERAGTSVASFDRYLRNLCKPEGGRNLCEPEGGK